MALVVRAEGVLNATNDSLAPRLLLHSVGGPIDDRQAERAEAGFRCDLRTILNKMDFCLGCCGNSRECTLWI
jgi:hypothetical protein